jgi:hypothetical protein
MIVSFEAAALNINSSHNSQFSNSGLGKAVLTRLTTFSARLNHDVFLFITNIQYQAA